MIKCSSNFDLITTNDAKFDSINSKRLTIMGMVMVKCYIDNMSLMMKNN